MKMKYGPVPILFVLSGAVAAHAPARIEPESMHPLQAKMERDDAAFTRCIAAAVPRIENGVSPEAGAESIVRGCDREWRAAVQSTEAWIATLPEAQRTQAAALLQSEVANAPVEMKAEIAAMIRRHREDAAAR